MINYLNDLESEDNAFFFMYRKDITQCENHILLKQVEKTWSTP